MKQIDSLRKQLGKQSVSSRRARIEDGDGDDGYSYPSAADRASARQHDHEQEHGARDHGYGHAHRHGRHGRREVGASTRRGAGGPSRLHANAVIDDNIRPLLDTSFDAARTRVYRAQFGADSVSRGSHAAERGGAGASASGISDVRDLLDSLSDSIAADCDSSVTQGRFYDGVLPAVQPLAGSSRLNLDGGPGASSDFAGMQAQWSRGQGGTGFSRGLPGGW